MLTPLERLFCIFIASTTAHSWPSPTLTKSSLKLVHTLPFHCLRYSCHLITDSDCNWLDDTRHWTQYGAGGINGHLPHKQTTIQHGKELWPIYGQWPWSVQKIILDQILTQIREVAQTLYFMWWIIFSKSFERRWPLSLTPLLFWRKCCKHFSGNSYFQKHATTFLDQSYSKNSSKMASQGFP